MKYYQVKARIQDENNSTIHYSFMGSSENTMAIGSMVYGLCKHEHLKTDTEILVFSSEFLTPLGMYSVYDDFTPLDIEQDIIRNESIRYEQIKNKEDSE